MTYLYEHTWLGQYGHLLIIVSLVGFLAAAYSYISALRGPVDKVKSWKTTGKGFFLLSGASAIAAIGILYYLMLNRFFEFHYVWKYTNHSMNSAYMLASFWSGQEGSLLLWAFWIILFSFIFLQKFKSWEAYVMPTVCITLGVIFSMLLGVYVGEVKIGSSPFILIRQLPENITQAWAQMPDYLQKVEALQDGVGLNPLLQNYWMVIHPPVLFSGFALLLFPFALALAGVIKRDLKSWVSPAIGWSVAGLLFLGTGILMGGAWAYEALSFGGFWAWDPVENASFVPWLLLLAGSHQLMITRSRQKGYFMAILLSVLPFIMVLYASFLTRSGILGDSSVHSFTENGLMLHLFLFLFLAVTAAVAIIAKKKKIQWLYMLLNTVLLFAYFLVEPTAYLFIFWLLLIFGFLLFTYQRYYPKKIEDDSLSSREFWMLAGIMLLLISSVKITISTSIPAINRLFLTQFDAFTNLARRNEYYAMWQTPFAIIFLFLMGLTQLLSYHKTFQIKKRLTRLKKPLLLAFLTSIIASFLFSFGPSDWQYALLLFAALFAIAANLSWLVSLVKKNSLQAGAAISHLGFALLIVGALLSNARKTPISHNADKFDLQMLDESFLNNENVLLRKGDTVKMNNYYITYRGKKKEGVNIYYDIGYYEAVLDHKDMRWQRGDSLFSLTPSIQQNEKFGNVSEPDTRHYWSHDVFTHVKWADTEIHHADHPDDDFMNRILKEVQLGKKYQHDNLLIAFNDIYLLNSITEKEELGLHEDDVVVQADFSLSDVTDAGKKDVLSPIFIVKDSVSIYSQAAYSDLLQVELDIQRLTKQPNTVVLSIREKEYLVMQALIFPGMNLLWTGCIVMIAGMGLVLYRRWSENGKSV